MPLDFEAVFFASVLDDDEAGLCRFGIGQMGLSKVDAAADAPGENLFPLEPSGKPFMWSMVSVVRKGSSASTNIL